MKMSQFSPLGTLHWTLISYLIFCAGCGEGDHFGKSSKEFFPDPKVRDLARAAANGNIKKIDHILDQGVDVNSRGKYGITPLWWALNANSFEGFAHLLAKKADPNLQMKGNYNNVMHDAAGEERPDFLEAAIKAGGNFNLVTEPDTNMVAHTLSEGKTPLFTAITMRNRTNVVLLINAGANINYQDTNGFTPAMHAGFCNDFETMYYLLTKGADPTLKDNRGSNTLVWEIENTRISEQSKQYQWRQKVIDLLKTRGIFVHEQQR